MTRHDERGRHRPTPARLLAFALIASAAFRVSVSLSAEQAPVNGLYSISVTPASVTWGGSAIGQIRLMHAAPSDKKTATGGKTKAAPVVVHLASSNSSVKVPATVTVKKGSLSATFKITVAKPSQCAAAVAALATAGITATFQNSVTATLTIGTPGGAPSRYTTKTVVVDPKNIVGVSHDAHALVLNGSDKCVQSLVAGDVILFKKLGVLEVKKVLKTGQNRVAVAVSSASLTDFINDGTFQIYKTTLGNAEEPTGAWSEGLEPQQPVGGDGDWKFTTGGSGSTYSFSAFKQNGGLSASVKGHGQITKFGFNFLAVIHQDRLQQATYKVDTDGTLDVDWMVQTSGPGEGIGESRLRLPALHSGLVDSPDDVPLLFQVYANLIFKPGFGEKAAAKGHFKITYSGEGGIDGDSPLNDGLDAKSEISSTKYSAMAAHGAVIAVNAPKFAISLSTTSFLWALSARLPRALNPAGADLADSLQGQLGTYVKADLMPPTSADLFKVRRAAYVMWVSSVAYAGAGLLAMLPCQQYYQTYVAQAGMDKDLLGQISGSKPPDKGITILNKGKTTVIPAIKGCEPSPN